MALLVGACARGSDASLDVNEPYPFTRPPPPRSETPVDGTYARSLTVEDTGRQPVHCVRCPPWRLDAGTAQLQLEAGRLTTVFEPVAVEQRCPDCKPPEGFTMRVHFAVDGDRLEIFNDPTCTDTVGVYRWSVDDGDLTLRAIDDPCPYADLRAGYLTATPWQRR
ncbi:MAG TPA: hypothetical protein VM307_05145 [Egibacteraceae bacterium]|nr:hypothetical protein [Egibacteraceae bacterium]